MRVGGRADWRQKRMLVDRVMAVSRGQIEIRFCSVFWETLAWSENASPRGIPEHASDAKGGEARCDDSSFKSRAVLLSIASRL